MNARPLLALAAALTSSLVVGAAAYAEPAEPRSIAVSYADLNIAQPAGRAALERRIAAAADRICSNHGTRDLQSLMASKACRTAALADAQTKVGLAALKASSQQYASTRRSDWRR